MWQSTRPGIAAQAAAVELLDVAVERAEVAHPPGRLDPAVLAEDVRVLDHVDLAERGAAKRRVAVPPAWRAARGRGRGAGLRPARSVS